MREIKFRAWDTELKMMVYENEQTGDTGYETNPVHAVNSIINEDYAEYIWMQYTGLKDKNRKEIYEGDIAKYFSLMKGQKVLGVVTFENGSFLIEECYLSNKKIEVIGNIYENPELLEVEE